MVHRTVLFALTLLPLVTAVWLKQKTFADYDCTDGVCFHVEDNDWEVAQSQDPKGYLECRNLRNDCPDRAAAGECSSQYMQVHCPRSCDTCHDMVQTETVANTRRGEASEHTIVPVIGAAFGEPQYMTDHDRYPNMTDILERTASYMHKVRTLPQYKVVQETCVNKHHDCLFWAARNECENTRLYMSEECGPICQTCEDFHVSLKCPVDPNEPDAWHAGDVDATFERILRDYPNAIALSRPSYLEGDSNETKQDYKIGPWLVALDGFVNETEARKMAQLGHQMGYRRSTETGPVHENGLNAHDVSETRTSTNAWCDGMCYLDPVVTAVTKRMEKLVGIPRNHSEYPQLLRYEEGQFYMEHHDYNDAERSRAQGVRILTAFLYLNDVEAGGETYFPYLDRSVVPHMGRIIVWSNVMNEAPNTKDRRTRHQALPVRKGIKYAANMWFHQREMQSRVERGC